MLYMSFMYAVETSNLAEVRKLGILQMRIAKPVALGRFTWTHFVNDMQSFLMLRHVVT
jgi:hypothetical protein